MTDYSTFYHTHFNIHRVTKKFNTAKKNNVLYIHIMMIEKIDWNFSEKNRENHVCTPM